MHSMVATRDNDIAGFDTKDEALISVCALTSKLVPS